MGGLCYLSNFRNDMFGGLRSNLPGRKEFLLPEYWQGGRVSCYAADIWAAAVSLYVLVKGVDPFPIDRLDRHMERMSHYSAFPEMAGFSAELQSLLQQCLNPRMAMRPTIETILVRIGPISDAYTESELPRKARAVDEREIHSGEVDESGHGDSKCWGSGGR